jgi:uncharacterized protein YjiS (DUF1127 family)
MDARVTNEEILLHLNPPRSPLARFADGLRAVWWALRHHAERRRAYEQLRALTDRELADIGLARGDIGRVFEPEFRLSDAIRATRTA